MTEVLALVARKKGMNAVADRKEQQLEQMKLQRLQREAAAKQTVALPAPATPGGNGNGTR